MTHTHASDKHAHAATWRESQPALGPASVLDIGGDIGAVLVRLSCDTPSGELLACPRGRPADHFHTGVHLRQAGDIEAWAAVFPAITEGDYSLLTDDGTEHTPFTVHGGHVTTLALDDRLHVTRP